MSVAGTFQCTLIFCKQELLSEAEKDKNNIKTKKSVTEKKNEEKDLNTVFQKGKKKKEALVFQICSLFLISWKKFES